MNDPEIERLIHTNRPWLPDAPTPGGGMFPFAACWSPNTPPTADQVAHVNALIRGTLDKYNTTARWTQTSSNGASLVPGNPIVLRVSFVPDGVQAPNLEGVMSASSLFANMDAQFSGNRQLWISKIQQAFARWSAITGVQYAWVSAPGQDWDDGAAWGTAGSNTHGDVRIAMRAIDGVDNVLAFNSFPNDGDMVMDLAENWADPSNDYRFLRNVIGHEHGHGLGLSHVCPPNSTKLMEPSYSPAFDGPQQDDMRGIHFRYGDANEPNNNYGSATILTGSVNPGQGFIIGTMPNPPVPQGSLVSLTSGNDQDWYRFDFNNGALVNATVTPLGSTYDSNTQNGNDCPAGNPVNALTQADVAVAILTTNPSGTTTTQLSASTSHPAGQAETVSNVLVGSDTPCFIKVYNSNPSGTSQSQMYRLNITSTAATNFQASDNAFNNSVHLTWTAITGVTNYTIFRGTTNVRTSATQLATNVTGTTYNDNTAVSGQVYTYWLRAGQGTNPAFDIGGPESGSAVSCFADLGRAGGLTPGDGVLDNNDFIAFINYFFNSDPKADLGRAGGLTPGDGILDNNDFIAFINYFFTGCP